MEFEDREAKLQETSKNLKECEERKQFLENLS